MWRLNGKLNCFGLMDASCAACIHDANRYPKKPKKNALFSCVWLILIIRSTPYFDSDVFVYVTENTEYSYRCQHFF